MTAELLRALRIIARADSDPVRQTLFAQLLRENHLARAARALHRRLGRSWPSTLLVSSYALKSYVTIRSPAEGVRPILSVAIHENERRQIERVTTWLGRERMARLRTHRWGFLNPAALTKRAELLGHPRQLRRFLRVVHRVNQRHDFLVSCRCASTLASYARARRIMRGRPPRAVLVASDSNPEPIGLSQAARSLGLPTIFISHAYPTPVSPPLCFTLSILEGPAALDGYRRLGPVAGRVLFRGVDGESAPLAPERLLAERPVIGIFAPKTLNWRTLGAVMTECRRRFDARKILIRWHPNMLGRPRLKPAVRDTANVVVSAPTASLVETARQCDWVIAGENSNVHLPVLKLGVPTITVAGLCEIPDRRPDLYGFIEHRITPPPVASLADLSIDAAIAFYTEGWAERFRRYDAGYLLPPDALVEELRRAISQVLEQD